MNIHVEAVLKFQCSFNFVGKGITSDLSFPDQLTGVADYANWIPVDG